jgi:hypothetical protein
MHPASCVLVIVPGGIVVRPPGSLSTSPVRRGCLRAAAARSTTLSSRTSSPPWSPLRIVACAGLAVTANRGFFPCATRSSWSIVTVWITKSPEMAGRSMSMLTVFPM